MNPLKKGPEIKLSELRVPRVLDDLYYDLKERHLLPVVALLLVGIVAVPLLLGGSSGPAEAPPPAAGASASTAPAKTSSLVVTEEAPELRDYRRRLEHLSAKDPFVQQYVEGEGEAASRGGGEANTGEGGEGAPTEVESPAPGGEAESGGSPPVDAQDDEIVFFTFSLDVRVVPVSVDGKRSKAEPYVRRNLPPLTMLPSRETPALTYMGPSRDGKKALMMVSSDVTAIFGDSICVVGSQTCQLLALEPGRPETVVFGPLARTYRIELLKIEVEATDDLERAPLGEPKRGGTGQAR